MVDTPRTLAALQALLADNSAGDISAQDVRDFLVSVYPDSGAGAVGLIAATIYDPDPRVTASTTSDSFSDIDASNLKVDFTVPPSGAVLVRLSASVFVATATQMQFWALREGTTTVGYAATSSTEEPVRATVPIYVSGLTPGDSLTYKWAHRNADDATSVSTRYGSTAATPTNQWGPAVMEVLAVT